MPPIATSFLAATLNDILHIGFFTESVTLGEQDRMALMCIYDFEDWNH